MTERHRRTRRAVAVGVCTLMTLMATAAQAAPAPAAPAAPAKASVDRHLWDEDIVESSGLTRSTYPRRLLWTHNDSGDEARVFGVGPDGETKAVLWPADADSVDWEDMASGPGHSLWVGDIGDNGWDRGHVTVYRFDEPKDLEDGDVEAEAYDLEYPGGARDAEAIMVRPRTGRLFVISKVEDGGAIYRAPRDLSTSSVNRLKRVGGAPATITGASFAPDGQSFVLVSYTKVYVYSRVGGKPTSVTSKVNNSEQGESVTVGRRGARLLLGEEGSESPVWSTPYKAP